MTTRGRHSADDWPQDDDPFVGLLRDAMHRQVDGYYPAGDGLQRIQSRVARRQRWMAFRPVFAAVALASVVALVAIGVSLVPGSKNPRTTLADDDQTTATATSSSGATGAGESGSDGPLLMMWPYQDAAQAAANGATDIGAGGLPDLTDPVATTQSFADTMFPGAGLTAGAPVANGGIVGVPIESPSGPVGEAQLQPVATGDVTVYGVLSVTTSTTGNGLVVNAVSKPEDGSVEVKGTLGTKLRQTSSAVNVALYAAGPTPAAQSDADLPASGSHSWSTDLSVPDTVSAGYVLVWSSDAAGTPTAIAAVPIGSGESSSPAPSESSSASSSDTATGPGATPPTGAGSSAQSSDPAPQDSGSSPQTSPTNPAPPTTTPSPSEPTTPSTTPPSTSPADPTAPPTYSSESDESPADDVPALTNP